MLVASAAAFAQSKVYMTREISPESLVRIYKALGVPAKGRVAVKMSTGEGSNPNYLKPELVRDLVLEVDGTIVECNTAYGNGPADKDDERNTSENHWKVIERHGFTKYFPVDIMDEYDEIRIPVKDQTHDCPQPLQRSPHGRLWRCTEESLYRLCQSERQGLHPLCR